MRTLGRYELLRPIAKGGMATVYLGRVSGKGGFERLIAVKLMHPHVAGEPEFVAMFLDEARLAARIRHPNVVSVHDVGESPEGLYLVMDYIEGAPYNSVVQLHAKQKIGVPVQYAVRVLIDVLEGLHAAHELSDTDGSLLGLVHRDVSPQNVLVGSDGVSRITDFGVAYAETRLSTTQGSGMKGKIAYLSPEQVQGLPLDRRSDVFSAGVVLWESLVGRRLFRAQSSGQTLNMILNGGFPAPHELRPEIPTPISDVCMRALAIPTATRYQSALDFAEALDQAAQASSVRIANRRAVAAFLKTLDLQIEPVNELLRPMAEGSDHAAALVASAPTSTTGDSVASLVSTQPPPSRSRKTLVMVLGAVGLLGAVGALLVVKLAREPGTSRPAANLASEPAVPSAVAVPEPSQPQLADAAPPASAASAAAEVEKAEPVEPKAKVERNERVDRARPREKPSSKPGKPSATSYRPPEL